MALPAHPQTFGLENCKDILEKLDWEITELRNTPDNTDNPDPLFYRAFNCAVTAWQLVDWVWHDLPDDQRKEWKTRSKFGTWCRKECPAVNVCRQVATASKHVTVTDYPDHTVTTTSYAEEHPATFGNMRFGDPFKTWRWKLVVGTDEGKTEALAVFLQAQQFWDHFIVGRKIEGRPLP